MDAPAADAPPKRTPAFLRTSDKKLKDKLSKAFLKQRIRRQALTALTKYRTDDAQPVVELEPHEHMLQFRQEHLKPVLSIQNASQVYRLDLTPGDYCLDYSTNGRHLLLANAAGHAAVLDWKRKDLLCELNLRERVSACKFMHLNFFALAQKNNTYVYDTQGLEIHHLDNVPEPLHLEYLPYHYLLVSLSRWGKLTFTDASIGQTVAEVKAKVHEVR